MAIQWTPWFNVPLHRRLEVLAVAYYYICALGSGLFSTFTIVFLLVTTYNDQFEIISMNFDKNLISAIRKCVFKNGLRGVCGIPVV